MKVFKIKNTEFNLDALKGYSKSKFLRENIGTEEHYEVLSEFINPKKKVKKEKEEND